MNISRLIKNTLRYPVELCAAHFGHHRRDSSEARLWIMMYHRILPADDDRYIDEEPGMIVEPETFKMHIDILQNEFTLVSLTEWLERKQAGLTLPEKSCAITFDDGWLDNYEFAFPILKQKQVPATLFAVSHMVGTDQTFWPNRVARLLQLPSDKLRSVHWLAELLDSRAISEDSTAQAIYQLKDYSDAQLIEWLNDAETQLQLPPIDKPVLMNWQQMCEMSDSGLVEIGSHTCHHVRLRDDLPAEIRQNEIIESKKLLEENLKQSVKLFCYPNGDFCDAAVKEVAAHYQAAVTTQPGINRVNDLSLHQMFRVGVHQDMSNSPRRLLARVACWP